MARSNRHSICRSPLGGPAGSRIGSDPHARARHRDGNGDFSVVDSVLLRPLVRREPDRLVSHTSFGEGWRDPALSLNWNSGFLSGPTSATCRSRTCSSPSPRGAARAGDRLGSRRCCRAGDERDVELSRHVSTGPYLGRMFTPAEDDVASDSVLILTKRGSTAGGRDGIVGRREGRRSATNDRRRAGATFPA